MSRREIWTKIGYAATAAWMVFVLARTGGDPTDPFFDYLFVVPLGAWILAIAIVKVVERLRGRHGPDRL